MSSDLIHKTAYANILRANAMLSEDLARTRMILNDPARTRNVQASPRQMERRKEEGYEERRREGSERLNGRQKASMPVPWDDQRSRFATGSDREGVTQARAVAGAIPQSSRDDGDKVVSPRKPNTKTAVSS
eukprot:765845-Hanusia_phi.AAC.2